MKNKKILSISVAAYNLGELIKKNLDSFLKCKNKELLEIIVTNDGSIDNTKEIVEEYVNKYPAIIKLINQENKGAGSTVNSGIKNATAKYFKMVDGDDWINSKDLDLLIEELINIDYDMVLTNYEIYSNYDKKIISKKTFPDIIPNKKYSIDKIPFDTKLSMHNIIYKTSLLQKNNVILDNGFYTDQEYMTFPLKYVKNVIYYDLDIYVYMIGRDGQSVDINSFKKHIDMHKLVLVNMLKFYIQNKNISAAKLIKKQIILMAKNHLNILLCFKMDKYQIKKIKQYCLYLKNCDKEIYEGLKKDKKAFLIINSNFILTKSISYLYKKKNNY